MSSSPLAATRRSPASDSVRSPTRPGLLRLVRCSPLPLVRSSLLVLLLIVLGMLLLAAAPASAQSVRGVVVEAGSGEAVEGALVSLVDASSGAETSSTLTGTDGAYVLRATAAGEYRLRVERIGYETWVSGPFRLGLGESVTRRLSIPVRAVSLAELEVAVESRCAPRPGAGPALARAWEEARKALELTRYTEERSGVGFELRRYERDLDPETGRVRREESRALEKRSWRSFVSAPAEELSEEGWVRRLEAGGWRYYAPDAEVLLSETFAEDHCFSLVPGSGEEEGLVGLRFEPVEGRRVPEVAGTLWLDAGSAELRRLEYRYTGLERPLEAFEAGGRVELARLPTGHWFVRRWHIAMPIPGERWGGALRRGGRLEPRHEITLAFERRSGGEVVRASLPGGETLELAEWGAVAGAVHDSLRGGPLAGIEIALSGTAYRGRTDPDGRFRLDPVPPGEYTLTARHPDAALLNLAPLEREVSVEPERTATLELAFPSFETVFESLCPAEEQAEGVDFVHRHPPSALAGYVHDAATGEAIAGAHVWIARSDWWVRQRAGVTRIAEEWSRRAVETDSAGAYAACGLEGNWLLVVQAVEAEGASDTVWVRTTPGTLQRLDLEIEAGRRPAEGFGLGERDLVAYVEELIAGTEEGEEEAGEPSGHATLVGTVKSAETGQPVSGARVRLLGRDEERVTGADGAFVIPDLPRGRHRVVTEHLGLASDTAEVDLRLGDVSMALFTLDTRPVELPTLEVEIERTVRSRRLAGFYERMDRGLGEFITREDLEAMDVISNFRRIPNVRIDQCVNPNTGLRKSNCWTLKIARGVSLDTECPPLVYLNGHLLFNELEIPGGEENAFTILQSLPRNMLEGIEVYRSPGAAPAQYRMLGDACGIVLVWTRGRR